MWEGCRGGGLSCYHPEVLRNFMNGIIIIRAIALFFLSGKVTEDIIRRVKDTFGSPFGQYQLQTSKLNFPYIAVPEKRIFTERKMRCKVP